MKTLTLLLAGCLMLGGCATLNAPPTFNQLGNFSTYPLNAQTFRIRFDARQNISYGTAQEIALVQSARTTIQQGFRYFEVMNDPSNRNAPPRQSIVYNNNPVLFPRPFLNPWNDVPQVITTEPSEVSYTINCYKTAQNPNAFDAKLILQNLGAKYGINENGAIIVPPPR